MPVWLQWLGAVCFFLIVWVATLVWLPGWINLGFVLFNLAYFYKFFWAKGKANERKLIFLVPAFTHVVVVGWLAGMAFVLGWLALVIVFELALGYLKTKAVYVGGLARACLGLGFSLVSILYWFATGFCQILGSVSRYMFSVIQYFSVGQAIRLSFAYLVSGLRALSRGFSLQLEVWHEQRRSLLLRFD